MNQYNIIIYNDEGRLEGTPQDIQMEQAFEGNCPELHTQQRKYYGVISGIPMVKKEE